MLTNSHSSHNCWTTSARAGVSHCFSFLFLAQFLPRKISIRGGNQSRRRKPPPHSSVLIHFRQWTFTTTGTEETFVCYSLFPRATRIILDCHHAQRHMCTCCTGREGTWRAAAIKYESCFERWVSWEGLVHWGGSRAGSAGSHARGLPVGGGST